MSNLTTTIVNDSSHLLVASIVLATALARTATKSKPRDWSMVSPTRLAGHTKADTGIEPGSITLTH